MSRKPKRSKQEIINTRSEYDKLYGSISSDIKKYVTDNLLFLNALDGDSSNRADENMRYSYSEIANKCTSSVQTVYSWFTGSGEKTANNKIKPASLPKLWHAVLLARLYDVDVDYLVTDHTGQKHRGKKIKTYYDMFTDYLSISNRIFSDESKYGYLENQANAALHICDPVLAYLAKEYFEQKADEKDGKCYPEKLEKWLQKISIDFRIPYHKDIPYSIIDDLIYEIQKSQHFKYEIYLTAARLLDKKYDGIMEKLEHENYHMLKEVDEQLEAQDRELKLYSEPDIIVPVKEDFDCEDEND